LNPKTAKKKNNTRRAFTLSELLLAALILLIVISGLLSAFISCIFLSESNHNRVIAANDAQYVLEQIKGQSYGNINNFVNNFSSSYFNNLNAETITFLNFSGVGAKIADITVNVAWTERQNQKNFQLSTRVAK